MQREQEIFRVKSLFIGANVREATNDGRADYVPVFLSETPLLFRRKHVELDVAIVQARKHLIGGALGGGGIGRVHRTHEPVLSLEIYS